MIKISGVYKIQNLKNNKIYIGQSFDIKRRIDEHFNELENGIHLNKYLQYDFDRYKRRDFSVEVLCYFDSDSDHISHMNKNIILLRMEEQFIHNFKKVSTLYNVKEFTMHEAKARYENFKHVDIVIKYIDSKIKNNDVYIENNIIKTIDFNKKKKKNKKKITNKKLVNKKIVKEKVKCKSINKLRVESGYKYTKDLISDLKGLGYVDYDGKNISILNSEISDEIKTCTTKEFVYIKILENNFNKIIKILTEIKNKRDIELIELERVEKEEFERIEHIKNVELKRLENIKNNGNTIYNVYNGKNVKFSKRLIDSIMLDKHILYENDGKVMISEPMRFLFIENQDFENGAEYLEIKENCIRFIIDMFKKVDRLHSHTIVNNTLVYLEL